VVDCSDVFLVDFDDFWLGESVADMMNVAGATLALLDERGQWPVLRFGKDTIP
jgi:hypothetical protein